MFTGLVEAVGRVAALQTTERGLRITIEAPAVAGSAAIGDSIATDGVCLTVVAKNERAFSVEAIGTTLSRTTVSEWTVGRAVNLEQALAAGDRLGGHFVQGHVDGFGTVTNVERAGEHVLLEVEAPEEVMEVTVLHGSITIDGVSLTVNALPSDNALEVALIPHTWENTNLQRLQVGDRVNLEGDMLGRFVIGYLRRQATARTR